MSILVLKDPLPYDIVRHATLHLGGLQSEPFWTVLRREVEED